MHVCAVLAYALPHAMKAIIASELPLNAMTTPPTLFSLPLFPLHTVLFPGGHLPLRVFEQRYRMMVRGCHEQDAPFGVVTLLTGNEVRQNPPTQEIFHAAGTLAQIDGVTSMHSGLEMVDCLGKERFRIHASRKLPSGLWVGDVQLLPADLPVAVPPDLAHSVAVLQQVLHKRPQRHLELVQAAQFDDCGWVANRWCELFPMEDTLQLQLLETQSPLLRLELVTDALEGAGIVPRKHIKT